MITKKLIPALLELVHQVGDKIVQRYDRFQHDNILEVSAKADKTPLTETDLLAHQLISDALQKLTPDVPILSEESSHIDFATRRQWQRYWLVDPLDGTRDFLEKTGDFTINIALIEHHQPILGVVYVPVTQVVYYADETGAFKQIAGSTPKKIHTRKLQPDNITILASRHHDKSSAINSFCEQLGKHTILHRGSALKFGLLAEGIADIYLRLAPTSEWDTAAGQCILERAGGKVLDLQWQALQYNGKELLINPHFLAIADPSYNWRKYFNT